MDATTTAALITAVVAAVISFAQFVAGRRERSAAADRVEAEASGRIFSSYGDLVGKLQGRIDQLQADMTDEQNRRRELERELDQERQLRQQAETEIRKMLDRLTVLETENQSLRQLKIRVTAIEAENANLKAENEALRETIAEWRKEP